jgi:hypothetical protein
VTIAICAWTSTHNFMTNLQFTYSECTNRKLCKLSSNPHFHECRFQRIGQFLNRSTISRSPSSSDAEMNGPTCDCPSCLGVVVDSSFYHCPVSPVRNREEYQYFLPATTVNLRTRNRLRIAHLTILSSSSATADTICADMIGSEIRQNGTRMRRFAGSGRNETLRNMRA